MWIASTAVVIAVAFGRDRSRRAIGLLAFQWGWAAAAYHAARFSRINPAACLFAAGFAGETAFQLRCGPIRGALVVGRGSRCRWGASRSLPSAAGAAPLTNRTGVAIRLQE